MVCLCVCVCVCARMCETKKHMCKQTRACARKRVHERMHVHGHVFSSALLTDFYLSTPRATGRAHMHQNVCVAWHAAPRAGGSRTRRVTRPRAGGARTGRVTRVRRRWCDAREKEVALHAFAIWQPAPPDAFASLPPAKRRKERTCKPMAPK